MSNVRIREAQVNDAAAIAKVHVDSWRTTYAGIVPDDFLTKLSYGQRERNWRNILSTPDSTEFVYVAEDAEGSVIGFASGGPERSGDADYKGELYAIYLLDKYQHKGIGRQLTVAAARRLLQQGFRSMLVWVLAENPSRAFYEALGAEHPIEDGKENYTRYVWRDLPRLAAMCPLE